MVDLSNCDREPIHVPGAVQPHGVLFAVDEATLEVRQVSENVAQVLGRPPKDVLGRPLDALLAWDQPGQLGEALAVDGTSDRYPLRLVAGDRAFDALVHRYAGALIVEIEPAPSAPPLPRDALTRAVEALQRARTVSELCESVVRQVRRLTGFERVMVYCFDEAGHGAVIAEDRAPEIEPYLGLHYPASDIPKQARELYLKTWLRIIPDARYAPARVVPPLRPDNGQPLDLSCSILRSVSPIHLEYLANMGVRASMSVSIIVGERLWGLISCGHHSGPHYVSHEVRSMAETIGRLISLQLGAFEDLELAAGRHRRRPAQRVLAEVMRAGGVDEDVLVALLQRPDHLLSLVDAGGVAVTGPGGVFRGGNAPSEAFVEALRDALEERGDLGSFATDHLASLIPSAEAEKDCASGALAFALPGVPHRWLFWFRPEVEQTVHWGGDPRKPALVDAADRLHPRRSFELWKEQVRLRSLPWSASDLAAATELRRTAVEVDLERQVERERRAVRARDDLVAVVSHDLKSPLNVIQLQATLLLQPDAAGEGPSPGRLRESAERIQRAVDRMNVLIRDLLDLSKIEAGRFQVRCEPEWTHDIVRDALTIFHPLAEAKRITLTEEVERECVQADRERVFQVLSNLINNSLKVTPEQGTIVVRARRRGQEVVFTVADTGPGLSPEQIPHVFERYWQAERAGRAGSGLGLYIVQGIVLAHRGRVWCESPPGSGARFHFTLPVWQ